MKYPVISLVGKDVSEVELPDEIFDAPVRKDILWFVVRWQQARKRRGTHCTKTRSEVRGGGRKPWRQKHTGRARQGSIRAAQWRGGYTVHGPRPRSYEFKVNKKVRKFAVRSALSYKAKHQMLKLVDGFPSLDKPSTKKGKEILKTLGLEEEKALIVLSNGEQVLKKSFSNLPNVKVLRKEGINVYDILKFKQLILPVDVVDYIKEVYAP